LREFVLKLFKFLIIFGIVLFPGIKGCNHTNKSNIVKLDCSSFSRFTKVPGTPNIKLVSSRCSNDYQFKKEVVKSALDVFVNEYSESFDVSESLVWENLRDLKIEVSIIPRTVHAAFDINGNFLEDQVAVNGLAFSQDHIWVEIKTSQIWSSALIHELVHVIIWRQNKVHGDPDHEGEKFSGWTQKHTKLIKRVNNILLEAEI